MYGTLKTINLLTESFTLAGAGNGAAFESKGANTICSQVNITIQNPSATTFTVNVLGNIATLSSDNTGTGTPVTVSTTGTLPDPLVAATTYYLISLGQFSARFASSLANALAGIPIVLTTAGTGTQTLTPTIITQVVPSANINVGTNLISLAGHSYLTGAKVTVTTSDTLPDPLALATTYFVIAVDANTFQLATTYANALASVPIVLTTAGIGNQSFILTAASTLAFNLQASDNLTNWSTISTYNPATTANTANSVLELLKPPSLYYRISWTITAGQISVGLVHHVKGVI